MRTPRRARIILGVAFALLSFSVYGSSAWARHKDSGSWTAGAHHRIRPPAAAKRIVKVSLENRVVYVLEGARPLLIAPTCSGGPGHATPTGRFHVTGKAERRRSSKYGFWVKDGRTVEGTKAGGPPDKSGGWSYVGYPMPFWVKFQPGYGFHEGFLWSTSRTHGCLHLSGRDAQRFFRLVDRGTPISIRQTQPEDQTLGKEVHHPEDEKAPDPPSSFFLSERSFTTPWENLIWPAPTKAGQTLEATEPSPTTHKEPGPDKSRGSGTAGPAARPS